MNKKICYHFHGATLRGGLAVPPLGEWLVHDGPVAPCYSGLHASEHPYDALTYGEGSVLDPFMGSGSTIAAAEAVGYRSAGIEIDKDYFRLAEASIPKLAALYPTFEGDKLAFDSSDYLQEAVEEAQLSMALAESRARYRAHKRLRS